MKKKQLSKSLIATGLLCTIFGSVTTFAASTALYRDSTVTTEAIYQGVHALSRTLSGTKTDLATALVDKAKAEAEKIKAENEKKAVENNLETANNTITDLRTQLTNANNAVTEAQASAALDKKTAEDKGSAVAAAKDEQLGALKTAVDSILSEHNVVPDSNKDSVEALKGSDDAAKAVDDANKNQTEKVNQGNS